jgi:transcription initiation factor IIF auxiliary subunit
MRKWVLYLVLFVACSTNSFGQTQPYHFDNEFGKWKNRNDYFNWKVFLVADNTFLKSIRQVEYYLDPSFKTAKQIIKYNTKNPNFTLCSNGWGEFTLRIKIIFNNPATSPVYDVYRLDLHSARKKNPNYVCVF